jgi:L-2-hydroxyglutarate oxidase
VVHTPSDSIQATYLINCAGLHSDRITELGGEQSPAKIIPFKGEYFELTDDSKHLCKNLIYPVPDPEFPFLGVHFTRMIDNSVECGPNAVLAFGREAYGKFDLNLKDLLESIFYPGFQKMAMKHWRMGWGEMWRSYNKGAFVKALQRIIPKIEAKHLQTEPWWTTFLFRKTTGSSMFATPLHQQQLHRSILEQPLPRIYRVASKEIRTKLDFKIG